MTFLPTPRVLLATSLTLATTAFTTAGPWPQWRGPAGTGVTEEKGLPAKWSERDNVVWKCPLPGEGASTPAIWGDAVFLTVQQEDKLLFLKINRGDGKVAWTREVGRAGAVATKPKRGGQAFHKLHNLASPSPATDGEVVIAHFGTGDLAAFDFAGKQLWHHDLQKEHGSYTIWWGHANSPVLWKDLVISVCMQDPIDDLRKEPAASYLVAHDRRTGKEQWKSMRMTGSKAEDGDSYTTPLLYEGKNGPEMIVVGANQIDAYDPATGKQRWYLPDVKGSRTITGPTLAGDLLVSAEGKRGAMLAVRLGGAGKRPADAVAWKVPQSTPDSPSPVAWDGLVFWTTDDGIAHCHDARTGAEHWKERLRGDFKASLLAGDGKVYFLNRAGQCTVVKAAPTFEVLAENQIDDETTASLAVSDGRLFLRGKKALYCIGGK